MVWEGVDVGGRERFVAAVGDNGCRPDELSPCTAVVSPSLQWQRFSVGLSIALLRGCEGETLNSRVFAEPRLHVLQGLVVSIRDWLSGRGACGWRRRRSQTSLHTWSTRHDEDDPARLDTKDNIAPSP